MKRFEGFFMSFLAAIGAYIATEKAVVTEVSKNIPEQHRPTHLRLVRPPHFSDDSIQPERRLPVAAHVSVAKQHMDF